jgi:RNA polymerase sigma-70 factor (subfamily 1)
MRLPAAGGGLGNPPYQPCERLQRESLSQGMDGRLGRSTLLGEDCLTKRTGKEIIFVGSDFFLRFFFLPVTAPSNIRPVPSLIPSPWCPVEKSTFGGKFRSLLERARAGCMFTLGTLLDAYRRRLLAEARPSVPVYLRGRVAGSDLVQETCREAQLSLQQFSGESEEEWYRWLRGILRTTLLDAIRRHKQLKRDVARERALTKMEDRLVAADAAESDAERRESEQRLKKDLEAMDERKRKAVELRLRTSCKFAEIGRELGCSAEAARKLYHRGLRELAEHA